jgi:hypothetical protein
MRKKTPEIKEDILYPFDSVEFFQKWQEWLLYRKQRRISPYTPIGLNRTFGDLFKDAGGDVNVAMAIIDQSIGKSWQGLFPLKNQQNGNNNNNQSQVQSSEKPLIELLMIKPNSKEVAYRLGEFKERGELNYRKVLAIDRRYRIPNMVLHEESKKAVVSALAVVIGLAMKKINLKYPMDEEQLVSLALAIIDQSYQDQLAIEDVMLFLQKLVAGEYGDVEYKMDSPLFFKYFEVYREDRFQASEAIKDELHRNYKSMGPTSDDPETYRDIMNIARKNVRK